MPWETTSTDDLTDAQRDILDRHTDFLVTTESVTSDGHDLDLATDAINQLARKRLQRLEYDLLGAWRAGYNYVHQYSRIDPETFSHTTITVPSHTASRQASVDGHRYECTYDLTDITTAEVRDLYR